MSMSVSVTEFSEVLPPFFPPSISSSVRVGGVVVVVGSCGGNDSGTQTSTPSSPVFHLSLNVVNECCMKTSGQHLAGSGPIVLS